MLTNAKTFLGEEGTLQHKLVVKDLLGLQALRVPRSKPVSKRNTWQLKGLLNSHRFRTVLIKTFDEKKEEIVIYSIRYD